MERADLDAEALLARIRALGAPTELRRLAALGRAAEAWLEGARHQADAIDRHFALWQCQEILEFLEGSRGTPEKR
jgi:hypothetical protein